MKHGFPGNNFQSILHEMVLHINQNASEPKLKLAKHKLQHIQMRAEMRINLTEAWLNKINTMTI